MERNVLSFAETTRNVVKFGDYPGHDFHGNQWTQGAAQAAAEKHQGESYLHNKAAHKIGVGTEEGKAHAEAASLHEKASDNFRIAAIHKQYGTNATANRFYKSGTKWAGKADAASEKARGMAMEGMVPYRNSPQMKGR